MSLTIHSKYKYFDSTVQRVEDRWEKFHFYRLPFAVNVMLNLSNKSVSGQSVPFCGSLIIPVSASTPWSTVFDFPLDGMPDQKSKTDFDPNIHSLQLIKTFFSSLVYLTCA